MKCTPHLVGGVPVDYATRSEAVADGEKEGDRKSVDACVPLLTVACGTLRSSSVGQVLSPPLGPPSRRRRHGQSPSISTTTDQLRNVRTSTSRARTSTFLQGPCGCYRVRRPL